MKLGIRSKLFAISLGLIALSLLIGYGYARPTLDRALTERIESDLTVRLGMIASVLRERPLRSLDVIGRHALARHMSELARVRVTLLDEVGTPLADSDVEEQALQLLENHRTRPEVAAALRGGMGASRRYSATLQRRMMYVATTFDSADGLRGVIRLAMPLTEVDQAVARLHLALSVGGALALLVAVAMSSVAAHFAARSLRQLTQAARRMVRGDLHVTTQPRGEDEVATLGRDLSQLAASLASALGDLVAERDLLNEVLSGMREGVMLLDPDGKVALLNPALKEMLMISGVAPAGLRLSELLRDPELVAVFENAAHSTGSPLIEEVHTDGLRPRRLLVQLTRLAGPRQGLLAVLIDVTDLRRLEHLRRDFVANASHELRTPVTALRSALETLRLAAGRDPQNAERFLEMAERNAARLHRLVDDLLDLSRIESQQFRLELEPLPLTETVSHLLALFQQRAASKRIALSAELPSSLPPVLANRRALEQVLSNLIDNALKYCPADAEITLSAEPAPETAALPQAGAQADTGAPRPPRMIQISVRDSGPGIPQEHLPRLFERFYRVDAGRSRELGGTGLGLAIVRHLVEAMGGTVRVTSQPGRGSVFTFTLPVAAAAAAESP